MKTILTSFAVFLLATFILPFSTLAKVDKDIKYVKENLPYLLESNNAGTSFYLTFLPCWEENGPNNANRIYISSAVRTKVTMKIPYLGKEIPYETVPNDIIEIALSPQESMPYSKGNGGMPIPPQPEQVWDGRAVILESDAPIIVYAVTRYQYTSDGYLAYPLTALGKTYQVASYADPTNNQAQFLPSYTGIVSPYDNTKVRFRLGGCESCRVPKYDGDTLKTGEVITRVMNKGDVWLIPGIGPFNDLTGSKITSNKPIAVVSGNFCAYIPTDISACDFIVEQELPENVWGTKYHVTPIDSRRKYPLVKVFAKKPLTKVYCDGGVLGTVMTPGGIWGTGYLEVRTGSDMSVKPGPAVISSDEGYPINVVQFNPGQSEDNVPSDPFQMQLSPIEQYQKEIVFNTPGIRGGFGFSSNFINVVYKATVDGGIPDDFEFAEVLDGKFSWTPVSAFSANPGTRIAFDTPDENGRSYYSKTIKLPYDGVYRLRAKDAFVAYAYGFSSYDSYGFPTSVATADLETPDTLAPLVEYAKDCDGFVAGNVIDEPRIDPANRSNLGLIYMDTKSFNYKFNIEEFIIGESPSTTWTLDIVDPTVDAKAYLTFIDRRGNRTDTTIEHYAISPEISEYAADYGTFKLEKPELTMKKTFTITNNGTRDIDGAQYSVYVTLDSKETEDKPSDIRTYQNFDLLGVDNVNLAPLKVGQEIKFSVQFTARAEGAFRDSIGIIVVDNTTKDTCFFHYFTLLQAFVGNQYIIADDYDFPATVVGTRTAAVPVLIKNPNTDPYISTNPLKVTGYTVTGDNVGSGQIFEVKGLETLSPTNPILIDPGKSYQFTVSFQPDAVRDYAAEITFIADSKIPDNVTKLTGKGVQPGLIVNGEDWGRKRVDPNSYKVEPGAYQFDPYPSANKAITIKNDGSSELTLNEPEIVTNLDNKGSAFLVEYQGQKVPLIDNLYNVFNKVKLGPNEERTFNVFFHPQTDGQHELELKFTSDAPVTANSVLRGYGIYPKDSTFDYNFGKFVVGTAIKTASVRFYNNNWVSEDTMNVSDFKIEADAGTTFGLFGSSSIFRWDRNNVQDKNGNVLSFPFKIAPGDFVTVFGEYQPTAAGTFTGRISTISDAQKEAVSTWTGTAIDIGVAMDPAQAITCQRQAITLTPVIRNTGSVDMEITSLVVRPNGSVPGFNAADFAIQVTSGTVVNAGASLNIPIVFTPTNIYLPSSSLILEVKTAGTGSNNVITRADSTNLTVTATFDQYTSKSGISVISQKNNGKVAPGTAEGVKYTVTMNRNKAISTSYGKDLEVKVIYKLDFLGLAFNDQARTNPKIALSPAIQALGYQVGTFNRKVNKTTNEEVLTVNLVGNSSLATQNGDIELFTVTFDVFLPIYKDDQGNAQLKSKTTEVSHLIATTDPCFVVSGDKGTVELDETCVDGLRPIQISATKYNLGQVNPNPVSASGGEINFAVGGSNIPTEIKIYNSESKLVGVVFNGTLNSGEYSVRIPIETMSSGVYFYEMVSGPYRDTKKMIVQK
ncbi:MAG TPA: T9SS type A sorting domain-containing protein [Candidatus Kapabacteria bacterium]|nr:T9SS type A sorting domain-containing protein [Candidatus Kapabacteria bacterium]